MSTSPENHEVLTCSDCGAVIYEEHIHRGLAAYREERLLCPHCLAEYKESEIVNLPLDQERVSLVDESEMNDRSGQTSIQAHAGLVAEAESYIFKRPLNPPDQPPTRLKVFHAKLSDGAVRHLERVINEWIDNDPEVHVKSSTMTIGQWEGKHAENHLIITVYY